MEFPKLEEFLIGLQKSWEKITKAMDMAKETIKKQFDKKRWNPQGLKKGDNIWLEAKNIHLNRPSKKLNQKRYRSFWKLLVKECFSLNFQKDEWSTMCLMKTY